MKETVTAMENKLTLIKKDFYTDYMEYLYRHNDFFVDIDQLFDVEEKIMLEATLWHKEYGEAMTMLVVMRTRPDKQASLDEFVRKVEDLLEDYEAYYELEYWEDKLRMERHLADMDDDAESETA